MLWTHLGFDSIYTTLYIILFIAYFQGHLDVKTFNDLFNVFMNFLWSVTFHGDIEREHGLKWVVWLKTVLLFILHSIFRSSRSQIFFRTGVLKIFANFTRKRLCWSLFLIKLPAWRPVTLLKRDSNIGVFLWHLQNF